jgi:hypothetical protein
MRPGASSRIHWKRGLLIPPHVAFMIIHACSSRGSASVLVASRTLQPSLDLQLCAILRSLVSVSGTTATL